MTIFDAANWFINKEPITAVKCQILCYYLQAWALAAEDNNILNAEFRAGIYGPQNDDLHDKLKKYPYPTELIPTDALKNYSSEITDENDIEWLEEVWRVYGKYDRFDLEHISKQEIPWLKAHKGYKDHEICPNIISEDDMKVYYKYQLLTEEVSQ